MSTSLPLPSGATLEQWLIDAEALAQAPIEALLPADTAALVAAGEKLVNRFVSQLVSPNAGNVLGAEVDAEQAASAAVEDAKFGPAK